MLSSRAGRSYPAAIPDSSAQSMPETQMNGDPGSSVQARCRPPSESQRRGVPETLLFRPPGNLCINERGGIDAAPPPFAAGQASNGRRVKSWSMVKGKPRFFIWGGDHRPTSSHTANPLIKLGDRDPQVREATLLPVCSRRLSVSTFPVFNAPLEVAHN